MKEFAKKIFVVVSKLILPLFYDKKYFKGRWFDEKIEGYKWAWKNLYMQKIHGYNSHIPWPVSHRMVINNSENIEFDVNDLNNFQHFGCYYQNFNAKIIIGKGTYIAPNVGIITSNHDVDNLDEHQPGKDVIIKEKCWIGMNSIILPGVLLGEKTIVGAGSVVTKSFPDGNCIVAGNPAKVIRNLN